jgi:hypothetical protein
MTGCATPADQAAQAEREVQRMVQIYGPACDKLGYQRNSDPWRNCVMNLSMRDDMARYSSYYGPFGRPYWTPYWAF